MHKCTLTTITGTVLIHKCILVPMCPPSYHHNGFMTTPELEQDMELYMDKENFIYSTLNERSFIMEGLTEFLAG